jgi:hypothetical protein
MGNWMLIDKYPPLTRSEILDIEQRARRGEEPTKLELALVERQNPIIDGELLMTSYRGQLFLKRYLVSISRRCECERCLAELENWRRHAA